MPELMELEKVEKPPKHKDSWEKGLVCPRCGLIKRTEEENKGEMTHCPLCEYFGTFLFRNLWLKNE